MSFPFPFKLETGGGQEELPKPEEVMAALVAIPPRLSALQTIPATPEIMFENMVKEQTGVEIPPGPNRLLVNIMKGIEAQIPAPPGGKPRTTSELTQPSSKEAPKPRRRFELT